MTLHILGAGSIGLLYAASMRLASKSLSSSIAGSKSRSLLPLCVLLQPHHADKLKELVPNSHTNPIITFLNEKSSCMKTMPTKTCISTRFTDVHGNVTLLDIPSEIVNPCHVDSSTSAIENQVLEIANGETSTNYIENILLTTKAPQAVHALESIMYRFHPTKGVNLIIMTNGCLAVVDEIMKSFERHGWKIKHENGNIIEESDADDDDGQRAVKIICASTTHGAMRIHRREDENDDSAEDDDKRFSVIHTGVGYTFIEGDDTPEPECINEHDDDDDHHLPSSFILQKVLNKTWENSGLRSTIISPQEMYVMNWKKLAANCAINPLTALRKCRNGELLVVDENTFHEGPRQIPIPVNDLDYREPAILDQLVREVSEVALAEAEKRSFIMGNGSNCNPYSSAMDDLRYENLLPFVESVARNTARNKSSMLQDVLSKRYPTEIMYLNGYVARLGRDIHGIDVRANHYITKEIENITKLCS